MKQESLRVVVCGDRNWPQANKDPILRELAKLPPGTLVIHGDCAGVDKLAGEIASELGFKVKPFPVAPREWRTLGKRAGPLRNTRMLGFLLEGESDRKVIAFHPDISKSKGTRDMVNQAKAAGVPVQIVTGRDFQWNETTQ